MAKSTHPKQLKGEHLPKQPGEQHQMQQQPAVEAPWHHGTGKLAGKIALVTGGDSGIGQAVAIAFAKEGAKIVLSYLEEHKDAAKAKELIEKHGGVCLTVAGDVGDPAFCKSLVKCAITNFKRLDIIVNNAAEQHRQTSITDISDQQLERTFRTNIFSMFYTVRAAMPYLKRGSTVINTTSVTAFKGSAALLDYSATKGAIVAFTRSLAESLAPKDIRVNAVAPGPIWTPLIPATFSAKEVKSFGKNTLMQRPGQPEEVAPCYVYLASEDASYITGQIIHVNGGMIVGS